MLTASLPADAAGLYAWLDVVGEEEEEAEEEREEEEEEEDEE